MKAFFATIALAGVFFSGCSAARPEDADDSAGQPDFPALPADQLASSDAENPGGSSKQLDSASLGINSDAKSSNKPADGEGGDISVIVPEGATESLATRAESSKELIPDEIEFETPTRQPERNTSKIFVEAGGGPIAENVTAVETPLPETEALHPTTEPGNVKLTTSPADAGASTHPAEEPLFSPDDQGTSGVAVPVPSATATPESKAFSIPSELPSNDPEVETKRPSAAGPDAAPSTELGDKSVSTPEPRLPATEVSELSRPQGASSNPSVEFSPSEGADSRSAGSESSPRPEVTEPSREGAGRAGDTPVTALLGQSTSRSRAGFAEDSPPEEPHAENSKDNLIGFSNRLSLLSWLSAEPIRRVGFSDNPNTSSVDENPIVARRVAFGDGEWEYRSTASWLRRQDAEARRGASEEDRSYEAVEAWLKRNFPEGGEPARLTGRDYASAEAWLRASGTQKSLGQMDTSARKYAALAKWLNRESSSRSARNSGMRVSPRRNYSKIERWLRGNREP